MRRKISLYIAGKLVDLDKQSLIQLNYTMEEKFNPTIVKNSFSQSLSLAATPNNNAIFGGMWRSDRITLSGADNYGPCFNAAYKTPFAIYNEMDEILEDGYCKLTKITKKDGRPDSYSVTLYGGLGAFFYALSYDGDGNKRTLADLKYTGPNASESELSFNITKEAVKAAWDRIRGYGSPGVWDYLNFAMTYNGLPQGDFDADKAIVDPDTIGVSVPSGYTAPFGYTLCKLKKAYTDLEAHDLRSYLQRPVIKFSKIIDAICQPYNNGGYEVILDESFFNSDNIYYEDVYLTLPIINTLSPGVQRQEGELIMPSGYADIPSGGNPSIAYTLDIRVRPKIIPVTSVNTNIYMHSAGYGGWYMNWQSFLFEFFDSDHNLMHSETVVVSSRAKLGTVSPDVDVIGHFDKDGVWVGDDIAVHYEALGVAAVRVTTTEGAARDGVPPGAPAPDPDICWTDTNDYSTHLNVIWDMVPAGSTYSFVSGTTTRTGALITKQALLSSDKTPADYLLAYCKTFGLVFHYDKGRKQVTIMTKSSFYNGGVIDISERIDLSQKVEVLPFAFDAKWYAFSLEVTGEYEEYYENLYGRPSGEQRVNTGYDFDASTKNLVEGLAFKGACEVLEFSRHYMQIYQPNDIPIPSVFLDGGEYTLVKSDGESENFPVPLPPASAAIYYWNEDYKGYDLFPKAQFHGKENNAEDERDCLLLHSGTLRHGNMEVAITDDTPIMLVMNDNKPCWILNAVESNLGIRADYIPQFSRNIYLDGSISKTLDFGVPFEVNIPDMSYDDGSTVYEQYWAKYIEDRYDDDSRVLTCMVDLSGMQVNEDLFRDFYYFDGSIWALNKIMNHSLTTYGDTKCEFVKVQDIGNYRN